MDSVAILLTIAVLILATATAVLAGSVPWLWWRALKLEQKVETLDEALASLMDVAGVKKE